MTNSLRNCIGVLVILCAFSALGASPGFDEEKQTMKSMEIIMNTAQFFSSFYRQPFPAAKNMTEFSKEVAPVLKQIPDRVIPMKDAWGNEFQYRTDPERNHFWVISYGSDGKPDAGIYDAAGIPKKDKYPSTTDPKSDIIIKDSRYVQCNRAVEEAINKEP